MPTQHRYCGAVARSYNLGHVYAASRRTACCSLCPAFHFSGSVASDALIRVPFSTNPNECGPLPLLVTRFVWCPRHPSHHPPLSARVLRFRYPAFAPFARVYRRRPYVCGSIEHAYCLGCPSVCDFECLCKPIAFWSTGVPEPRLLQRSGQPFFIFS